MNEYDCVGFILTLLFHLFVVVLLQVKRASRGGQWRSFAKGAGQKVLMDGDGYKNDLSSYILKVNI